MRTLIAGLEPSSYAGEQSVYEERGFCYGVGENVLDLSGDGESVAITRKEPEERKRSQKDARRIAALPDSAITEYPPRRISGIQDYRIENVSVSWRGLGNGKKREFLCHTCIVNVCVHTRRVKRYRESHSVESAA